MNFQKVINFKLDMLIKLMLTNGVSPSELSDNIFNEDYISISFSKSNEFIVGKLNFYDNGNILQNVHMVYIYSKDRRLIRIEEIENDSKKILWDRKSREEELIEEILYFMKFCYDGKQINEFIFSLPENLKNKIMEYMKVLSA